MIQLPIPKVGTRNLPLDYFPRWFEGYYNPDSGLRKLYWSVSVTPMLSTLDYINRESNASFYGPENQTRSAFVGLLNSTVDQAIPIATLHCNWTTSATGIMVASDYGTFLYQHCWPILFNSESGVLFKNLEMCEHVVTATNGYIDLTPLYSQHTRIPDSPIIVLNAWGDQQLILNQSERLTDTQLFIDDGLYVVRYLSVENHQLLQQATAYVTVNQNQIVLHKTDLYNSWDDLASLHGIVRLANEDNVNLKRRIQHMTLANQLTTQLAAHLDTAIAYQWATDSTLSFTSSGVTAVDILNYRKNLPVLEQLYKVANDWVPTFNMVPNLLNIFYNDTYVSQTAYTATSTAITPNIDTTMYLADNTLAVRANYIHQRYQVNRIGDYIDSLNPTDVRGDARLLVAATKIKVTNSTTKIKNWRWNRRNSSQRSTATFL